MIYTLNGNYYKQSNMFACVLVFILQKANKDTHFLYLIARISSPRKLTPDFILFMLNYMPTFLTELSSLFLIEGSRLELIKYYFIKREGYLKIYQFCWVFYDSI